MIYQECDCNLLLKHALPKLVWDVVGINEVLHQMMILPASLISAGFLATATREGLNSLSWR